MARKQRKRRQRRLAHEKARRQIHRRAYPNYSRIAPKETILRASTRYITRSNVGLLPRTTRPHSRRSRRQLNTVLSRVGGSVPTRLNTLKPLQAQPSSQTRKEHKCIQKPSSLRAHKGNGAYRNQWKPWCKGK
ncbi:MAG: hypothetical protein [Microviridae sp.]|nr:MAG: hypothetical protein [Microviridae sp.]